MTTPDRTPRKGTNITAAVTDELAERFLRVARLRGFVYLKNGDVNRSHAATEALEEWCERHDVPDPRQRNRSDDRRDGADRRIPRERRKESAA